MRGLQMKFPQTPSHTADQHQHQNNLIRYFLEEMMEIYCDECNTPIIVSVDNIQIKLAHNCKDSCSGCANGFANGFANNWNLQCRYSEKCYIILESVLNGKEASTEQQQDTIACRISSDAVAQLLFNITPRSILSEILEIGRCIHPHLQTITMNFDDTMLLNMASSVLEMLLKMHGMGGVGDWAVVATISESIHNTLMVESMDFV